MSSSSNLIASSASAHPDAASIRRIAGRFVEQPGALLPLLHAIQEQFGFIDREAVPVIADVLNLSRADVHGVLTFYHDFRQSPPGESVLKVCRAEACQSMGSRDLDAYLNDSLGLAYGETSDDGKLTVDAVYCLGLCACAPAVMMDGQLHARVSVDKLRQLLDKNKGERS